MGHGGFKLQLSKENLRKFEEKSKEISENIRKFICQSKEIQF